MCLPKLAPFVSFNEQVSTGEYKYWNYTLLLVLPSALVYLVELQSRTSSAESTISKVLPSIAQQASHWNYTTFLNK
jgi:hypothetical protein